MTSKVRAKRKTVIPTTHKPELKFDDFCRAFYKTTLYIHVKYIFARLFYLVQTLIIGWFIQFVWNIIMVKWFDGMYQVNLFEAAILWICVY